MLKSFRSGNPGDPRSHGLAAALGCFGERSWPACKIFHWLEGYYFTLLVLKGTCTGNMFSFSRELKQLEEMSVSQNGGPPFGWSFD